MDVARRMTSTKTDFRIGGLVAHVLPTSFVNQFNAAAASPMTTPRNPINTTPWPMPSYAHVFNNYYHTSSMRPLLRRGVEFLFADASPSGELRFSKMKTLRRAMQAITVYKSCRKIKHFVFDEFFETGPLEVYTAIENPMCTRCRPELLNLEMPNSTVEARFAAPSRCPRCSTFPGFYALDACTVKIDAPLHQSLVNFAELKLVVASRDIHGPLVNSIDARPTQDFNLHLFQVLLPKIVALQRKQISYFDILVRALLFQRNYDVSEWTDCRRYCSTFKAFGSGPATPHPTVTTAHLARLRSIWAFVALHGSYPVTTIINGPRTVLAALTKRPIPDMTEHAQIVEEQAELSTATSSGPGETAAFVQHAAAHVTGPIVVPTTILNPPHVSHGVEVRTQVQKDPRTGNPLCYNNKSHTAHIYQRFWRVIQDELFQQDRILRIYAKVISMKQETAIVTEGLGKVGTPSSSKVKTYYPDHKELGEYGLSKFGKDIINESLLIDQAVRSPEQIRMRIAHGKWEQIPKDGKTIRSVIDNRVELLTMVHVFGEIYTEAIFGEDSPFYYMNIKKQDRADALNQFVKTNAGDFGEPMLMWEVDQTSMEAHMRCPGPLQPILQIMQYIANTVCQKFSGQLGSRYSMKIGYDIDKGMRISIEIRGVCCPGTTKKMTLKFADFYLDSGWMLTAAANFSGETTLTMSCFCENPWHIFAKDGQGKYHINKGTFNHTYQSRPFPTPGTPWIPRDIKFNGLFEGDDGGGGASRSIVGGGTPAEVEATKQQLTYYMADVGMSAKFVLQINGRIEIIGAHMKAVDGRLDATFPWCPDIRRYLGKIGAATQSRQTTTAEGRTILAASRMISIASMFRGNVEKLHDAFTNLAYHHYNKLSSEARLKKYKVDSWSVEETAGIEAGITCLKSTFDTMASKAQKIAYPAQSTQELMILNSLQIFTAGHNVMGKIDIWSQDLTHWDGDHEAYYRQLPAIFQL